MENKQFPALIRRRSGRTCKDLRVQLEKPPETYVQGECLTIQYQGRLIPACVEIPLGELGTDILYVA